MFLFRKNAKILSLLAVARMN
jgi:hypothetical protein